MKIDFENADIEALAGKVVDLLKPLLADRGPVETVEEDKHFNVKQLSDYLGMSEQFIYNNKKTMPHFNLNRKPLFRKSEIDMWLEKFRVESEKTGTAVKPSLVNQGITCDVKIRSFKQRRAVTSC